MVKSAQKIETANSETHLIAQIETEAGISNAGKIAAVDGIDVLWIGHTDLENSLGIPGQFDNPRFNEALATVLAVCKQHNKVPGIMATGIENGKSLLDKGFKQSKQGASGRRWRLGREEFVKSPMGFIFIGSKVMMLPMQVHTPRLTGLSVPGCWVV